MRHHVASSFQGRSAGKLYSVLQYCTIIEKTLHKTKHDHKRQSQNLNKNKYKNNNDEDMADDYTSLRGQTNNTTIIIKEELVLMAPGGKAISN